MSDIGF